MAIEKKSLIGNRATVKKAVVVNSPARSENVTSTPAISAKFYREGKFGKFHRVGKFGKFKQG